MIVVSSVVIEQHACWKRKNWGCKTNTFYHKTAVHRVNPFLPPS